ncbi:transmembrane protease serine 11E-like [Achroia grisella]|uniref:transmembrane protease serine 11E-like n=1 Tax=Achroia grisella TaxID=688607 RepID=UPI0027D2A259|nr:transmembrane protease serine 11E-like [Achroia grisella]
MIYKCDSIVVSIAFKIAYIDMVFNFDVLQASKEDHIVDKSHLEPRNYESNIFSEDHDNHMLFGEPVPEQDHGYDSKEDIKTILEEKYRFQNDETSTRFKISHDDGEYPVFKEGSNDRHIAWAFRSYAARRIVGGMETSISMYPYNVAISRNGKHWCGGSIIDEQWVLTAGHCFESAFDGNKKKLQPYVVRAGSSFHNRGGYQARVNKVFFPENYSPGSADFDYCLLRLDRPMPVGRNIAVLNLPSKGYVMKEGDILIVTGWGSIDESGYGHIPDRMRFVPVPVMGLTDCQKSYRFYITPRMLCAGYATGGKDACNHDSGGPAVRDGVLLGIVSFGGKKCGDPRSPGVYSRVSQITDWVERTITSNEAYKEPELVPKIKKARQREKELQKFKARVEDKKNKIKGWLRETLKSQSFIELAKKKLKEAGFDTRRTLPAPEINASILDDKTIDEINLTNLLYERIFEVDDNNESDKMLRMLAMQEVMLNDAPSTKRGHSDEEISKSVEAFFVYVSNV